GFVCKSQETLGLPKREWFPWNMSIDLAPDQTPDDLRSLVFDSEPLADDLEILGNPLVKLRPAAAGRRGDLRRRGFLLLHGASLQEGQPHPRGVVRVALADALALAQARGAEDRYRRIEPDAPGAPDRPRRGADAHRRDQGSDRGPREDQYARPERVRGPPVGTRRARPDDHSQAAARFAGNARRYRHDDVRRERLVSVHPG